MRNRMTESGSSRKKKATRSRGDMALDTIRVSSSNTLVMTCCSRAASTPARAPASIMARMSSEVMRSSRSDDSPNARKSRSAPRL
ncbi:hypothetical protein D3C87_1963890 [compost metagenome]